MPKRDGPELLEVAAEAGVHPPDLLPEPRTQVYPDEVLPSITQEEEEENEVKVSPDELQQFLAT